MSGTGHTTKSVSSTGDQTINGLLRGIAWGDTTVFYSNPSSSLEYLYPGEPGTFSPINSAMLSAADFALDTFWGGNADAGFSVEGFTNLNIEWTTSAGAHIRLANTDTTIPPNFPNTAWGYYPANSSAGGDVWFFGDYSAPQAGNYHWHTMLHEIGHALGLKHGQEIDVYGALPFNEDSMEYSIMTYRSYMGDPLIGGYSNEFWGYAQTYMIADIAALQHMYGADFTTNSGTTVYKWNPGVGDTLVNGQVAVDAGGTKIFATIWDGGGIDTYDLAAYSTGVTIDLNPGGYSIFSSSQLANLGDGHFAGGNIYNALLYQGNLASLIENAVGGSGSDTFVGNNVDNTFKGNAGNDTMNGGVGTDSAVFVGVRSAYTLTNLGGDSVRVSGPDGIDTLTNIERLVFTDQTMAWNTFDLPTFELASFGPSSGGWSSDDLYKRELADVNGDGKADIVGFGHSGVYVSLATSNGHFASPTFELASFGPGSGGWSSDDLYKREMADVNGDGRDDIVGFGGSGVYVSLATSNGHFASPTFELASFGPSSGGWSSDDLYKRELADVNGDGKADIVGFGGSGVYVSLATGNGHFASPTFVLASYGADSGGWSSDNLYKREVADVNGDGKADIVGFGHSGVYVSLATSNGHFASPTFELASFGPGSGGWSSDDLYKRELADVDGDLRADIVGFGHAGIYVSQSEFLV